MPSERFFRSFDEDDLKPMLEMLLPFRENLDPAVRRRMEALLATGYLQVRIVNAEESGSESTQRRDVFICHSSVDKPFVRRLAWDLTHEGYSVWLDEFMMFPGDSLYEKIQAGIRDSIWFIVVLSPDSVASQWCKRELHGALEVEFDRRDVYVVPVMYRKCEVPLFLREKVWANCVGRKYAAGLKQILQRLALELPSLNLKQMLQGLALEQAKPST